MASKALTETKSGIPSHIVPGGRGLSQETEDNLVPLVYILQPLSPQVNKRNSSYIEGAEPGAIWLRNAPSPIVSGEEGIIFQPCVFRKDYVEWVPRDAGGGFVARHADIFDNQKRLLPEFRKERDPKTGRPRYYKENNEIVETRYHIGYVITQDGPMPYVIPLTSTGHTVSKELMARMNNVIINGGKADSWAKFYRLRTKEKTNAAGTWFTWSISDEGWAPEEQYKAGEVLFNSFKIGEKDISTPEREVSSHDEGDVM